MISLVRLGLVVLAAMLVLPTGAQAEIPDSLPDSCDRRDAADDDTGSLELPFFFCDDGVPEDGGRDPNETGEKAVTVPAKYDGHAGLPAKAADAAATPGADANGDVALDVDLSFPDPARFAPPDEGYPVVVFMHGCCAGNKTSWESETVDDPGSAEGWHYSNAWFASRGYVVVTYTSRGFVSGKGEDGDADGDGSTGETLIDHRAYEINDYQSIVAQLADTTFTIDGSDVGIDPSRIVATGGSYGGGFSWLALTDPAWASPGGEELRVAAVAPRYGWTDLAYALVPNGRHREDRLPAFDGSDTMSPLGFPKRSIVAGLYATGLQGATFPPEVSDAIVCLEGPLPFALNPQCEQTIDELLPSFVFDRSAYYQNDFFDGLATGDIDPVPVFSAGALTDPLFPGIEHRRMAARLLDAVSDYPIQQYFGDYQHFVQNKRTEWADLCGGPDVCEYDDYAGGDLDAEPEGLSRTGITTRLNRFIDHYAAPQANPSEDEPATDVTAALQVCPSNATDERPAELPGPTFTAGTFDALAPETLTWESGSNHVTTSAVVPNDHALNADPVVQTSTRGGTCPVDTTPASPGVAVYTSPSLSRSYTMIGPGRVTVPFTGDAAELQLNARLYDVAPDGAQTMVDRGFLTLHSPSPAVRSHTDTAVFDLLGNAWEFREGHRLRLEVTQDDDPYIRKATIPSSLTLEAMRLELPVREASATLDDDDDGGEGGTAPAAAPPAPAPAAPPAATAPPAPGAAPPTASPTTESSPAAQETVDREAPAGSGRAGAREDSSGSLPFTGLPLAGLGGAGLALVGAGLALRRRSRPG